MGNNVAAARGTLLLQHFPKVEAIVMVGIGGGVPSPEKVDDHVRLGDVVVSDRRGVIQYDYIKKTRKVAEVRASPRPPCTPASWRRRGSWTRTRSRGEAVGGMHVKLAAKHLEGAARPKTSTDVLHASKAPFEPVKHPR